MAGKGTTVSTKSEGPTWYMRDKVDGILTEIDDANHISLALKNLQEDKKLGEFFVKNATDRLNQMFDEKAVVDAYLKVFQGDFSG